MSCNTLLIDCCKIVQLKMPGNQSHAGTVNSIMTACHFIVGILSPPLSSASFLCSSVKRKRHMMQGPIQGSLRVALRFHEPLAVEMSTIKTGERMMVSVFCLFCSCFSFFILIARSLDLSPHIHPHIHTHSYPYTQPFFY